MSVIICPFCGMATEVPHDTQEACIHALQQEIQRTRKVLQQVTEPLRAPLLAADDDRQLS